MVIKEAGIGIGIQRTTPESAFIAPKKAGTSEIILNNPGFIPSTNNLLSPESETLQSNHNGIVFDSSMLRRPQYHQEAEKKLKDLARMGFYNSCIDEKVVGLDGKPTPYNLNLFSNGMETILEKTREALRSGEVKVLLPFAKEAGTIGKAMRYANSRVGESNVIAIDAGVQESAASEAKENGNTVNQKEVLSKVNWEWLRQQEIVPKDFPIPPVGFKGLTLYAGYLHLEAQDQLRGSMVVQHDTDIVNVGSENETQNAEGQYGALEHLALPLALPTTKSVNGIYLARTGEGRNNEPWTQTTNLIANFSVLESVRNAGRLMSQLAWPLAGERAYKGDLVRTWPRATGMETETMDNFCVSGQDVIDQQRQVMQVANPNPKSENRPSPRNREFAIVNHCAIWANLLARHSDEIGRLPNEWTVHDISNFNVRWGGRKMPIAVPYSNDHHPNENVTITLGYVLPSMQQMRDIGAVDWDAIRSIGK